jgi:hypothetical protein
MGCLGIFVAIALVVGGCVALIAVSVGGGGSSFKDTHVAYADGSSGTVTAGSVKNKVTLDKITDPAVSSNGFEQPQAGNHFIAMAVTIENVGTSETTGLDVRLRATDGTEYDRTFISGVGASDLSTFQSLTSGGKTDGVLAFEVKDGTIVQWLKFDPNPFTKGDLYFDKQ